MTTRCVLACTQRGRTDVPGEQPDGTDPLDVRRR